MCLVLGAELLEGTAGATLLPASEVVLMVVIDEGLVLLSVAVAVGYAAVLVVQDHIGVSVDALHPDAEAVGACCVPGGPGCAAGLGVRMRESALLKASPSVRLHEKDRRTRDPSPTIRSQLCGER